MVLGYPHVIGTMGEARNKAAINVARVFYKKLTSFTQQVLEGERRADLDGIVLSPLLYMGQCGCSSESKGPGRVLLQREMCRHEYHLFTSVANHFVACVHAG